MIFAIAIPAGLLIGSIPFGLILARRFAGIDIRRHGSGNIGATNVARVLGIRLGLVCFALDVAKGLIPTLAAGIASGIAGSMEPDPAEAWLWMATMASPVIGHLFSPWVGFRGGKGVATGLGSMLGVYPGLTVAALVALTLWIAIVWKWRYVGVASCAAAASLPIVVASLFAWRGEFADSTPFVIVTAAIALLVILKHRGNLVRTLQGTEPRFSMCRESHDPE